MRFEKNTCETCSGYIEKLARPGETIRCSRCWNGEMFARWKPVEWFAEIERLRAELADEIVTRNRASAMYNAVEAERNQLKKELAEARATIKNLETLQEVDAGMIEWYMMKGGI